MLAESLQSLKEGSDPRRGLRRISKQRLCGEHRFAIKVVLLLLRRLVADVYGTHSPVTGETLSRVLVRNAAAVDAVDWDQPRVRRCICHAEEERKIVLSGFEVAEPAERINDEAGVTRPAVPVVPCALRVR